MILVIYEPFLNTLSSCSFFQKQLPSLAETQFCNFFSATYVLVCTYIAGFDENSDAADAGSQIRAGET